MPNLKFAGKILVFFLLAGMFPAPCRAFSSDDGPAEALREDVRFLTDSTANSGRRFGCAGAQNSVFYVHRRFKDAGLWTRVQSFKSEDGTGHNVIGITPGFFSQYIVVGAYFDGLGIVGGRHYPGADCNASGIAAMLSLAGSLGRKCRRDTGIIFVAFDGHNADMSGSRNFVEEYLPGRRIVMMVNLDIIGSSLVPVNERLKDYLIVLGGADRCWELESAGRGLGLHLSYDYYGSTRFTELFYKGISDQKWFIQKRIPSLMFTSGITMNTFKTTDTADTLDYPLMAKRVLLIERWLMTLI